MTKKTVTAYPQPEKWKPSVEVTQVGILKHKIVLHTKDPKKGLDYDWLYNSGDIYWYRYGKGRATRLAKWKLHRLNIKLGYTTTVYTEDK